MTFQELGLDKPILRALAELGYEKPSPIQEKAIPPDIDYHSITALRLEARQKLDKIRPLNLGQASRISGVSPADISVLIVFLSRSLSQ